MTVTFFLFEICLKFNSLQFFRLIVCGFKVFVQLKKIITNRFEIRYIKLISFCFDKLDNVLLSGFMLV